ncbi:MAG: MarR family transcriptional regulator [Clostridia bacterium]|nr:MarR family transcriptional regulator [Clostridia bacterium]
MEEKFDALLLKNQLCFPIYAAANKIIRRYQPLLKKLDLTYTQYITMMVMWEKKQINEKVLVETLYLQSNTLAPLLKKLQQKGYIEIGKDVKDKRNIIIKLTQKGADLKNEAVDVPKTLAQENLLTLEEAIMFKKILYKILNDGKELESDTLDCKLVKN